MEPLKLAIARAAVRLVFFASALTCLRSPDHTQRVKDDGISNSQFARVRDNLIGVENKRMKSDAPRFVADNALAVLACCLRMVAIAVKDSCAVVRHLQTPSLGSNEVTVLTGRRFCILVRLQFPQKLRKSHAFGTRVTPLLFLASQGPVEG